MNIIIYKHIYSTKFNIPIKNNNNRKKVFIYEKLILENG